MNIKILGAILSPLLLSACSVSYVTESSVNSIGFLGESEYIDPNVGCDNLGDYSQCLVQTCFSQSDVVLRGENVGNSAYRIFMLKNEENELTHADIYHRNTFLYPNLEIIKNESSYLHINGYNVELTQDNEVNLSFNGEDVDIVCYESFRKKSSELF